MDEIKGMWRHETLKNQFESLVPERGPGTRVDRVAIELCLGKEVFITGNPVKQSVAEGAQISIPSGQMALLLTEERICIPATAMGFISMKSMVKLDGLVNVSGFHVDPGYNGHLVFSVFNAGPASVRLTRSTPLFMLFLCSLDGQTEHLYDGTRCNLNSITDQMVRGLQGTFPSPPMLLEQMRTLHGNVTDEIGRLKDRVVTEVSDLKSTVQSEVATLNSKVQTVKWLAGTIGAVLGVLFSGLAITIWQAFQRVMSK